MPDTATESAPETQIAAPEVAAESTPEVMDQDALDAKVFAELNDGKAPDENDGMPPPLPDGVETAEETPEDSGPKRGADGKFAPKDEQPEAKKPEAKKDDKPAEKKQPPDRETRRKVIAAKEIVGRILKWDDDKIDAMDSEELIDLGQRLKPTFETVESLKNDLQKWKDRARGQKAPDADTPDNGPRRSREPVDDEAGDGPAERDADGIDELIRDNYLDEGSAKVLRKQVASQVRAARLAERAKSQENIESLTSRAEAAERALLADRLESTRSGIVEKFPQLSDDKAWDRVLGAMDELDPNGVYAKGDRAKFIKFMERVAWSELGEDVERTTRHRLLTGNRKDVSSQPRTSSQASPSVVMTQDAYDDAVGRAAMEATSGGTFNQAKFDAIVAKIPKPK